jgi:hypothetical protein
MLGEKVCAVTLDVADPVGFGADADALLLARLRQDFEGRCHLGAFVVRVLAVQRRSALRLSTANTSGAATVDAQFLAEVYVLGLGDLLAPVEIVRVTPLIVGHYRWLPGPAPDGGARAPVDVAVAVLPGRGAAALAVGHRVAVRVVRAEAPPNHTACTAAVELLACDAAAPAFRLRGALGRADGEALAPLAARIEAELKARAALPPEQREALWLVEGLYYAFAGRGGAGREPAGPRPEAVCPAWEGPPGAPPADGLGEARDLLALARAAADGGARVAGVWRRPLQFYRSAPCVAFAEEGKVPAGWPAPTEGAALPVFATFLRETLGHLEAMRALAAVFRAPGERERHAGLWAALRAAQK